MADELNVRNHTGSEKIIYTGIRNYKDSFHVELAGITYPDPKYHIRHNSSSLFVFEYIQDGRGFIEYDGTKAMVQAGDFYLISAKTTCLYYADPSFPYQKIWINVCGDIVEKMLEAYHLDTPVVIARADAEKRIEHLHFLLKQPTDISGEFSYMDKMLQLELGIHELIAFVSRCQIDIINPPQTLPEKIRQYLDEHVSESLSLDRLSKLFFISRSYLNKSFQKEYNQSPYEYFLMQKMKVACNLLRHTRLPIQEIAAQLSFSDAHYFSNIFKKMMGCHPSKYRSMAKEEQDNTENRRLIV